MFHLIRYTATQNEWFADKNQDSMEGQPKVLPPDRIRWPPRIVSVSMHCIRLKKGAGSFSTQTILGSTATPVLCSAGGVSGSQFCTARLVFCVVFAYHLYERHEREKPYMQSTQD